MTVLLLEYNVIFSIKGSIEYNVTCRISRLVIIANLVSLDNDKDWGLGYLPACAVWLLALLSEL